MTEFFILTSPSDWAVAPARWSHSTLTGITACPRRWQLTRSEWGEHKQFPQRQQATAIKGIIIHEGLDRLAQACARLGMPSIGSPLFSEALTNSDFFAFFPAAIKEWNAKLRAHPRHGPHYTLRINPQDLANLAIQQFREQYISRDDLPTSHSLSGTSMSKEPVNWLEKLGLTSMLSEVEMEHPELSFMGKIDRIHMKNGVVEIVDFKSGAPKPEHRIQLERYTMLWWRNTGNIPVQATAQYLNTKTHWAIDEEVLLKVEELLGSEIESAKRSLDVRPANPKPSQACRYCPVRARCEDGWGQLDSGKVTDGNLDLEVTVASQPSSAGFLATSQSGQHVNVVHQKPLQRLLPTLKVGDVGRIIGGRGTEKTNELEVKVWTEVYKV